MFLIKSLNYYGGFNLDALYDIISHGYGFIFNPDFLINECFENSEQFICSIAFKIGNNIFIQFLTWIFFILSFSFIILYIYKNKKISSNIKMGFLSCLFSGVFGISALLSVIFLVPAIPLKNLTLKVKI